MVGESILGAMVFARKHPAAEQAHQAGRVSMRTVSALGTVTLSVGALLVPVDFVTESPGPTFNTIGEFNGKSLIEIDNADTYPVSGNLDMTTVSVAGGPNSTMFALGAFATWLENSSTVLPADLVYAPTLTSEEVSAQNSAEMTNSQEIAQAAALNELGIGYQEKLSVTGAAEGGPSEGVMGEGDLLLSLNQKPLQGYTDLTDAVNQSQGEPVEVTFERDGAEQTVTISPTYNEEIERYVLGLYIKRSFDFPLDVTYGLEEVGGPSAGMMFALGIMDELTKGEMTGGKHFAGTGTIDSDGTVGPIGGVVQKMQGAADAGARVFLAPADNCGEVIGNVPSRLTVVKVSTLSEAADAVTRIGQGEDPASFPTCN